MRALLATATDDEDPLAGLSLRDDHPPPSAPEGWEVVTVRAAALNHHDLWSLRGVGLDPARLPIVLGCDAAGVTADGEEVICHAVVELDGAGIRPGADSVSLLSERFDGTFAEQVAVPRRNLVRKPAELSFPEAACLPTAYLTAYRMLFVRGGLRPGQRVLIQGAGGGVATAALLLARAAGLHVTVASRDPAKGERARALGAHDVVAAGQRLPARVHGVLETVGEATFAHSIRAVLAGGVIVVAGATSGPQPGVDLRHVFSRQLRIVGSTMGSRHELEELVDFMGEAGIRPVIDEVLAFEDAHRAFAQMATGSVFGKLVFTP